MKRRTLLSILAVGLLHGILSFTAAAQNPGCIATTTWWPSPDGAPPLGWTCCFPYPGTYVAVIVANLAKCPPPPKCPCSSGAPPNEGGNPIYFATGDTYIDEKDVSLPGLGGGLTLSRRWNSLWPTSEIASSVGLFGPNWRSTYEERIFMGSDNWLTYARGDGGYWSFGLSDNNTWVVASPANVSATLSQTSSYILLTFQNGEQRHFDLTSGLLTAIIDRNGNTTQVTYDSSHRLATVTDPASRHLYFNYANGSSLLVTSVTSDFGITVSYSYDTQGRLIQVTKPDQTTISFTYNTQSQITAVTDSHGKILESHTYDSSGRGLTSSQANGVNSLTVTYPQ
jgi:YD repeat-containing protein